MALEYRDAYTMFQMSTFKPEHHRPRFIGPHEETKMATTATVFTFGHSQQPQNTESSSPTQAQDGNPTGPTSHNYLMRQDIPGMVQQFADIFQNKFQRFSDSTVTGEANPVVCTGCTTSQPPSITSTSPVTAQVTSHVTPVFPGMVGYSVS